MKVDSEPFITIGIASYNYARYLNDAFEAIKRQKFTDFEVLYCDDGSTDDSVKIIREFIDINPGMQIRLVQGENIGVMGNKNRILDNARGKYVMLCDADDWMEDNCLEVLGNKAKETDADQVAAAFQNISTNGKVLQIQNIPYNQSKWTWAAHHATLYKRSIIEKYHIRMLPDAYPDDLYFNMAFHIHSGETTFVNTSVYNWRTHEKSTSSRKSADVNWHGYHLMRSAMNYILEAYKIVPDAVEKTEIEYMAAKIYWLCILYRDSSEPFSHYWKEYVKCRKIMDASFPAYRSNPAVKSLGGCGYVRKRTSLIIFGGSLAERLHLIKLTLLFYWLITHCREFGI